MSSSIDNDTSLAVQTLNLTYKFPGTEKIGLQNIDIKIEWGTFNLLVGPNGAGKSTLLKLLAGKTLIKEGNLLLGGVDPFEDHKIRSQRHNADINQYITYLGTEWASNQIVKRDINVRDLISSIGGDIFTDRRDDLINILDIDPHWSMLKLSDGERRRVQIAMGLIKPWRLLLLDEVTIDLDVIIRQNLMKYLKNECNTRSCCVIYATHIFDGLHNNLYDRLIHISDGLIKDDVFSQDLTFENGQTVPVTEEPIEGPLRKKLKVSNSNSLHPVAQFWLQRDLQLRGSREEEKLKMAERVRLWNGSQSAIENEKKDKMEEYFKSTRSY